MPIEARMEKGDFLSWRECRKLDGGSQVLMLASFLLASLLGPGTILMDGHPVHPHRLIVQADLSRFSLAASPGAKGGMKVLRKFPEIGFATVEVSGDLLSAKRALAQNSAVVRVDFDRAARLAYTPNDTLWPNMWHFPKIKAELAWDVSKGSSNTVIAVIDTGMNTAHEDLAANVWTNAGEIAGNGIDDDANGLVDDVEGYDFAYNDPIVDDFHGHGTACAGIAAAVQDNNKGISGVAPLARIMPLKATDNDGYLFDSYLIPSYMYAANMGAKVISMSYFSDRVSYGEKAALEYCVRKGILPVAAAGNANTIYSYYPAAYDMVLSVAATTQTDAKASFSDFGTWVDVAAPGVSLYATTAGGGYTSGFGGTSGACPHVAGLAALLRGAFPNASASTVRNAIEDSALLLNQAPFGEFSNYGRIDCQAALQAMSIPISQKDPIVRYATPLGVPLPSAGHRPMDTVIAGRGLAKPRRVAVQHGRSGVPLFDQQRDWLKVPLTPNTAPLRVSVNGVNMASISVPSGARFAYPLIEGSTQGANLVGGFFQTLQPDGSVITVGRRSDGVIWMHGTFRRVLPDSRLKLVIRRSYVNGTGENETIQLYNWSTASYPYGSFDTLSTVPCPITPTTISIPIADIRPFLDDDRTVYLRILTGNTLPADAELRVDMAYLGY